MLLLTGLLPSYIEGRLNKGPRLIIHTRTSCLYLVLVSPTFFHRRPLLSYITYTMYSSFGLVHRAISCVHTSPRNFSFLWVTDQDTGHTAHNHVTGIVSNSYRNTSDVVVIVQNTIFLFGLFSFLFPLYNNQRGASAPITAARYVSY